MSKLDSLKIIKYLQGNWTDIGFGIFHRHRSMEGAMPPEFQLMEEIIKNTDKLYKEFKLRITGDNGKKKTMIIRLLDIKEFNNNYFQ